MKYYTIAVEDKPIGQWKIYKNGAFFRNRRFYSWEGVIKFIDSAIKYDKGISVQERENGFILNETYHRWCS